MTPSTGGPDLPPAEPTPWAAGVAVSVFVAALTAAGVYSFGIALAQVHWTLAVAVNVIAAAGTAPTAWRWRNTPVTRWVLAGIGAGVLLGWLILLIAAASR
ncbi:DUF2537 domain-containing protein [Nocardia veterana]|uniref:DUF2537 domain-containing protein n=1 Tax=Nocardia veterana TaxID=132249 RepID=A0A7X6LTA5_9NOCA|nr:DUF2537 domain-containing protein [Nocardia veterana]NKY84090.1 DUF2537 domain-containing protein [Nocardia veterana]